MRLLSKSYNAVHFFYHNANHLWQENTMSKGNYNFLVNHERWLRKGITLATIFDSYENFFNAEERTSKKQENGASCYTTILKTIIFAHYKDVWNSVSQGITLMNVLNVRQSSYLKYKPRHIRSFRNIEKEIFFSETHPQLSLPI